MRGIGTTGRRLIREWTRGERFEALLFTAALALRVLAVWYERLSPFYGLGPMDSEEYLKTAEQLAKGTLPASDPYFWAPGYAWFLVLVRHVSRDLEAIKFAQAVMGALSSVLAYRIAKALYRSNRIAAIAGMTIALTGTLIAHDVQITPGTLDVFLSLLALCGVLLVLESRTFTSWLLAGMAAGASIVTRGPLLLWVPIVVTLVATRLGRAGVSLRLRGGFMATYLLGASVFVVPAVHHNWSAAQIWRAKDPTGTSWSDGISIANNVVINLYIGNDRASAAVNDTWDPLCFTRAIRTLGTPRATPES